MKIICWEGYRILKAALNLQVNTTAIEVAGAIKLPVSPLDESQWRSKYRHTISPAIFQSTKLQNQFPKHDHPNIFF
ncbi:MAG: hypothetical protein ACI9SP_004586 [Arenicella sp.]|jgi:hypothetical protein